MSNINRSHYFTRLPKEIKLKSRLWGQRKNINKHSIDSAYIWYTKFRILWMNNKSSCNNFKYKLNLLEFPYHLSNKFLFLKTKPKICTRDFNSICEIAMGTLYNAWQHNNTKLQCKAELYMVKLKRIYFIEFNKEIIGLLLLFFK